MSPIIRVDRLSKRYWIQHQAGGSRYRALRDDVMDAVKAPFRALRRRARGEPATATTTREEFWALRDVSFDLERGDVLGIIGTNGAGKSTLLKILSRITDPSEGRVELWGRVASLLEVGTGFHPELTGRENVFLNGAILGMSRIEIGRKFDEIVAFAGVEKFLDTPVKRYSSGMYVRLAFSLAAHLEPEILVVDEVLAVGDMEFQKKCLGKMQDVSSQEGRTVLFVSHQLGTIRQLCPKALLLRGGRRVEMGPTSEVIKTYLEGQLGGGHAGWTASPSALQKDVAIASARTATSDGEEHANFPHDVPIRVDIECRVNRWTPSTELRLVVEDSRGRRVFTSDVVLPSPTLSETGTIRARAVIPAHFLRPETYIVTMCTFVPNQVIFHQVLEAFSFMVHDAGSKYAASEGVDYGCVFCDCRWAVEYDPMQRDATKGDQSTTPGSANT